MLSQEYHITWLGLILSSIGGVHGGPPIVHIFPMKGYGGHTQIMTPPYQTHRIKCYLTLYLYTNLGLTTPNIGGDISGKPIFP